MALSENEGRAVLRARFAAAGYEIVEDVRLKDAALDVILDGWDAARRVGYEFVTTAAGDRAEFSKQALAEIEARARRGESYVLLVDAHDVQGEEMIAFAADRFLARVAEVRAQGTPGTP